MRKRWKTRRWPCLTVPVTYDVELLHNGSHTGARFPGSEWGIRVAAELVDAANFPGAAPVVEAIRKELEETRRSIETCDMGSSHDEEWDSIRSGCIDRMRALLRIASAAGMTGLERYRRIPGVAVPKEARNAA